MSVLKKRKVVMLPTNKIVDKMIGLCIAPIEFAKVGKTLNIIHAKPFPTQTWQPQHLYILSEEEIKEGDWRLDKETFLDGTVKTQEDYNKAIWVIQQTTKEDLPYVQRAQTGKNAINGIGGCKKIIATTDTSLRIGGNTGRRENGISIPIPQPSESFIQKYVEKYNNEEQITEVMVEYGVHYEGRTCDMYDERVLKVNPKDNTITIRQVKDAWTREEVNEMILAYREHAWKNGVALMDCKKWIEENL